MTSIVRTIPLLAAAALLAGCGSSSPSYSNTPSTSTPASTPAAGGAPAAGVSASAVKIVNYAFAAPKVAVKVGATIAFTNKDSTAHTATADDGSSFDTGTLQQGQSKTITFKTAGTFKYHCAFHAFMVGTVTVS